MPKEGDQDMRVQAVVDVHPDWVDDPLVSGAITRSDGTPVSVLSELSDILNHLEDVCPGVPVRDILDAGLAKPRSAARKAARDLLRSVGYTEEEVNDTFTGGQPIHGNREMVRSEMDDEIARLHHLGLSNREIGRQLNRTGAAIGRRLSGMGLGGDLSERQVEIALYAQTHSYTETARKFGASLDSVSTWARAWKVRQQRVAA